MNSIWEKIINCCEITKEVLDGRYGWFWDILTISLIVLFFNYLFKRVLVFFENHFKTRQQIWQQTLVGALYKPMSYFVFFFAAIQFLDFLSNHIFQSSFLSRKEMILSVAGILSLAWFLMKWKNNAIFAVLTKAKVNRTITDRTRIDAIDKILTVLIIIISGLMLLDATGNNLNTLIAFGGISGLALAFASQEVIASFFGGLMIYMTHPFLIGDWIILPEKSIEGTVEEIGWYTTKIRTLDKRPLYVPNSIFSKIVVVNPSQMSHRQFKEKIGIRYRDVAALKGIISDLRLMLERHNDVDQEMVNTVFFTAFGAYSLDISFTAYTFETSTIGFNRIKEKFLFEIIEILDKHNAELAYPTSTTCVETSAEALSIPINALPATHNG
ncbi:MAG: mechanosensitive ion channel family protein [Parachlamydiaceae bacterium]|nr:mechanosensitive ion channel family protein [Parachlamydiaceae bacterium]